ncbi:MAG: hypothetical protein ACYC3I_03380 [Gemmataceae bacterium]
MVKTMFLSKVKIATGLMLALSLDRSAQWTTTLDLQSTDVDKQEGEFTLLHGMFGHDSFHLVLADPERYSRMFANVYFGTGDNVLRKKSW